MIMLRIKSFISILSAVILIGCQSSQVQEQIIPEQEYIPEIPQERSEENDKVEKDDNDIVRMRPGIQSRDELTVAFSQHEIELDFRKSYLSTEAQIFTALYEGLFTYHPETLEPVPAMAERWAVSADRMQWTFTMRRNARYSNGDPVRSDDFRSAWLSILEPGKNLPYSSMFDVIEGARNYRLGINRNPNSVGLSAPDSRTLIVRLHSPASFFPAMLCHHSFSPIHPSMLNRTDWSPRQDQINWSPPLSNGPFYIVSMNDEKIVMRKNAHYWDSDEVKLNTINMVFAGSPEDASNLWNSGEARWIAGSVNLETLTDRSGIKINVMFATHYYFIRSDTKPWDDYRVRRAMALVLPWEEIRNNYLLPAESLIFPISGYPKVAGITETNIDEARRLMTEAGYDNLEGLPDLVIRLSPSQDAARVGSIMSKAWKEILGFNVRIEVISYDRYYSSMSGDGYTIGSCTWIGDFADPYAFLLMWHRESNLNDARLHDLDYDALLERSLVEEGALRLATLADAERLLLDRGTILPICYNPALNIIDTGELAGWYPNALDIHPFKYISFITLRPLPNIVMAK